MLIGWREVPTTRPPRASTTSVAAFWSAWPKAWSTVMKYQDLPPRSNTARAVPAVSAWVSSVQWELTAEQVLAVRSEVAAAVIITVRFFSLDTA